MNLRRYKNVLALELSPKTASHAGQWIGFHQDNMELAEISLAHWDSPENLEAWSAEISSEAKDVPAQGFISEISVNLTQICNLHCTYCAAGGDGTYGSNVPRLDLLKFQRQVAWALRNLPDGENLNIHYIGGEPLLYPKALIEATRAAQLLCAGTSKTVSFSITTNGTLITQRVADFFKDLHFGVTVSLDGPARINDRTRPAKGAKTSTAQTLEGLEKLKSVRSHLRFTRVNSVFGPHFTGVLETYEFLRATGMSWDTYNFNYSTNDHDEVSNEAYIQQMEKTGLRALELGGLTEIAKIMQFRNTFVRLETQTRLRSYCGAGKSLVQIDTKHDLYACNWFMTDSREKVGSLDQLDQEKWAAYKNPLAEENNCHSCFARNICAGGCMAAHKSFSGSKHEKDPWFCRRSRALVAQGLRFYYQALTGKEQMQ